jgi:hypothetical protein
MLILLILVFMEVFVSAINIVREKTNLLTEVGILTFLSEPGT